jgi:hypothetical protein
MVIVDESKERNPTHCQSKKYENKTQSLCIYMSVKVSFNWCFAFDKVLGHLFCLKNYIPENSARIAAEIVNLVIVYTTYSLKWNDLA